MPASARKSSLGASRRGAPRAHVPFRADDLEHGKRTGIAVAYVEHNSDEFEVFEKVIGQADAMTPPKPKTNGRKKRKTPMTPVADEDDENGEVSMELDSPMVYFSNARHPAMPSSVQRVGSSSRPVARASDVDFDELPSPRPSRRGSSVASRRSMANGNVPGPSNLSRSSLPPPDEPDAGGMDDNSFEPGDNSGLPPSDDVPTPRQRTMSHASFTQMDQDDDDDDEGEELQVLQDATPNTPSPKKRARPSTPTSEERAAREGKRPKSAKKAPVRGEDSGDGGLEDAPVDQEEPVTTKRKGKAKAVEPVQEEEDHQQEDWNHNDDDGMEPEIAAGLEEVEDMASEGSEEEAEAAEKEKAKKKATKGRGKRRKDPVDDAACRRSKRHKYPPLEYWRLEKVVYGKRESGPVLVPHIKQIVRYPKEPVEPLGSKHRRPRGKSRTKTATVEPEPEPEIEEETEWDANTEAHGVVLDYVTKEEVQRRVAFTSRMVAPRAAANNDFFFQKIFGDGDFIAAGQLIIPPRKSKPSKGTKDNTYVFYVIEGAVNFKVHTTSYVLAKGGMFLVPRGNMYYIENLTDREAKLFFAQARKIPIGEEETAPALLPAPTSVRRSLDPAQAEASRNRRSSGGPAPRSSSGPSNTVSGEEKLEKKAKRGASKKP
ncbi:hypothetical protein JAAARDRAFT_32229 [Jaapia argillacea MUCL 33604]|uniref:CENP-C homolog n=1 Tax=Jaapia argillacea MUCL 33604 TaxID=933084 RepID=A0A067QCJ6_9AGAM|nr:hypothetical protein JAAARDRAFT_32229 [Jaapia argillacea MUCL 33604]